MKMKTVIVGVLALAFVVLIYDSIYTFNAIAQFPKHERNGVMNVIEVGRLPNCGGTTYPKRTVNQRDIDFDRKLNQCISTARIDQELLNESPNRPELNQVYFFLSCETAEVSARVMLIMSVTDHRTWCEYRVGDNLEDLPKFTMTDLIVPPNDVWFRDRFFGWLLSN